MAVGIDYNTATHELINMTTGVSGFGQMLADAYWFPGLGSLLPLMILAILGIAIYGKTQNISATIVGITLLFVVMYPWMQSVMGSAITYVQPVFGLLILGSAYIIWRWMMYGTSG